MAGLWTRERVLSLAPDAASASAGAGLAGAQKWKTLGRSDAAIWGEFQGSGAKPYQTRVDLSEPAFKCSCPSRKFPCKHALGLMLIYAADESALKPGSPPGWVGEWLADRQTRSEKKAEKAAAAAEPPAPRDEAAAARRIAAREAKVAAGLDELSLWMADLVRSGFGAAQTQPAQFWEKMAARLVDAQAPGLARRVRELATIAFSGEGWQRRMLAAVGRLALLVAAYRRSNDLPDDLVADVRGEVGWTRSQDELLAQPGLRDIWCVVGQRLMQEEQLRIKRTWLVGEQSGRWALILHFAAGPQPMDTSLQVGSRFDDELVFYPSAVPLRALRKELSAPHRRIAAGNLPLGLSMGEGLKAAAGTLARNPWIERWPLLLRDVVIAPAAAEPGVSCVARDSEGHTLRIRSHEAQAWQLVAISGGRPLTLFGEWDGESLSPFSAATRDRFFTFVPQESGPILVRVA